MNQYWKLIKIISNIQFKVIKTFLYIILIVNSAGAQSFVTANPVDLKYFEYKMFNSTTNNFSTTFLRPFFYDNKSSFQIKITNENYFNNGAPNQENMDVRYFGKGLGNFISYRASYINKVFAYIFEPYLLSGQNINSNDIKRNGKFSVLNDYRIIKQVDFTISGLRQVALFVHWNGFGIGYGKLNNWWGDGQHTSIAMTNNTYPFKAYHFGTIKELKWKKIGINTRYTFSKLNDYNDHRAVFYTALTFGLSYYSNPIISLGFSRNYLSGGINVGVPWKANDAAMLVFEGLFVENKKKLVYTIGGHDPFDQTIEGYFSMIFPNEKLKIFLEVGINDHRQNLVDLISQPDHAMATIIGLRKYGMFHNKNLYFGFEYLNLAKGKFWALRATPNFYDRSIYNNFSYKGRRWGAHSGSDSDDFFIELGYLSDNLSFIPRFNFERHGLVESQPAEVKIEYGFETSYKIDNFRFIINYEIENARHLGFPQDNVYAGVITGKRSIRTTILRIEYLLK